MRTAFDAARAVQGGMDRQAEAARSVGNTARRRSFVFFGDETESSEEAVWESWLSPVLPERAVCIF